MKILISTDTYYPHVNGCSYFGQRLAHYLQREGHEILVIAPSKSIKSGFYSHNGIKIYGIRAIPLHYNKFTLPIPFFIAKNIEKVVTEFNPDVIHFQGHFSVSKTVLGIAEKKHIPVVGTNHFMPENLVHYLHLPKKLEKYIERKAWMEFRSMYERLHMVTSPTKTAADLVHKLNFSKEVLPISNGIDRKKFHIDNDGSYLRERYSIPSLPTLLYIGRLDKEKNVDLLLEAFALASKNSDIHFLIGGNGVEKNKLQKLSRKLGLQEKVTFSGFVPDEDLHNLYRAVDCFVIAGTAELQSIVTMEAMASGLPVIAVNAVALPELVHHEKNGYLFEHGDLNTIAIYMHKLLTDAQLRREMSLKSLEIIEKHDIRNSIAQFEDIYKSAIKNNY